MKLANKVADDPTMSMARLSWDLGVGEATVCRSLKEDLGLTSYVRQPRHSLTEKVKERCLERCKKVLNWLKKNPSRSTVKIFCDKIFTVDQVYNCRNDRYLAKDISEVQGVFRTKHPQQIMVSGIVTSDGKKLLHFFNIKESVISEVYYKVLRYTVLPWLKVQYPNNDYVWTQDKAPPHRAKRV